jgi:hypothetical protein
MAYASWPTFTPGDILTAAQMNTGGDNFSFLTTHDHQAANSGETWSATHLRRNLTVKVADGVLSVGQTTFELYIPANVGGMTVAEVEIWTTIAPTGAAVILDIHKNGTTIFTTQSNRPQIAAAAKQATTTTIEVDGIADGDIYTFIIDQVGSAVAGADLHVTVTFKP